jgi:hypothetical protein
VSGYTTAGISNLGIKRRHVATFALAAFALANSRENQPNRRLGGHHSRSILSGGGNISCWQGGQLRNIWPWAGRRSRSLSVNTMTDLTTWLHIPHRTSHRKSGRRGSVVSTVTTLRAGRSGVRIRRGARDFRLLGNIPPAGQWVVRFLSLRVKRSRSDNDLKCRS